MRESPAECGRVGNCDITKFTILEKLSIVDSAYDEVSSAFASITAILMLVSANLFISVGGAFDRVPLMHKLAVLRRLKLSFVRIHDLLKLSGMSRFSLIMSERRL